MIYNNKIKKLHIFTFVIYSFITQSGYSDSIFDCLFDLCSESDKTLCSALQSSIATGNATLLKELLYEPRTSTILNHPITINGAKTPFINVLIMDLIRRNQDPTIVSILSMQKDPGLSTKPEESSLIPYDPKMLIHTIQENQATSKTSFMDQLLQNAPLPARTVYQAVKYTTRIVKHVVKGASDLISRIKRGEYVTSHNSNNAVHCAVLLHSSKAVSLCMVNCRNELFTQKNDLGFTPLELAYIQRQALETSKTVIEQKLQLVAKRRIFKHSKLERKLEKKKNKIIENAAIIHMLENMQNFRRKQTEFLETHPSSSRFLSLSPKVTIDDKLETILEKEEDEDFRASSSRLSLSSKGSLDDKDDDENFHLSVLFEDGIDDASPRP